VNENAFLGELVEHVHEMRKELRIARDRYRKMRASRDLWMKRAREAEGALSNSKHLEHKRLQHTRRRVAYLEDQLLTAKRESNRREMAA
jgi:hypothetical protein